MKVVDFKRFSADETATWKKLFTGQDAKRDEQIVPQFSKGLKLLGMTCDSIPDISDVNNRLRKITGWQAVPVEGLEEGDSFYPMLAEKRFPVGNFIRDAQDLAYTPAPDVFHDLYGHVPFYTDKAYSEFCEAYGKRATKYANDPDKLRQWERLFWFTVEFGLIKTESGIQIFGAGIASSIGECEYALSGKPEVLPFNLELIRDQEFDITIMQDRLFLLENTDQLYGCLDQFESILI